jgi:hypothetical protein
MPPRKSVSGRVSKPQRRSLATRAADSFINEFNRYASHRDIDADVFRMSTAATWEFLVEMCRMIVDRVIRNRNIGAKTGYQDAFMDGRLFNAIRLFISEWLSRIDESSDHDAWVALMPDGRHMRDTVASQNLNFDITASVIEPMRRIVGTHWDTLKANESEALVAFNDFDTDDLDSRLAAVVKDLWRLAAPVFDKDSPMRPIRDAGTAAGCNLFYNYLSVISNDGSEHIISYIINHSDRTIEIYDALPLNFIQSYRLYYNFIQSLHRVSYGMVIVNDTLHVNLQSVMREHVDIYCLAWTLLYIYNRLVRGMDVNDVRRLYVYPAMRIDQSAADDDDAERFLSGFSREAHVFLYNTIMMVAPSERKARNEFFMRLFNDNDEVREVVRRDIERRVQHLTQGTAYYGGGMYSLKPKRRKSRKNGI